MRLCLFQPEIPQNTGTLLRLGACLGVGIDIIAPCGFVLSDKNLRRAGMDYMDQVDYKLYFGWNEYVQVCADQNRRLIALTPTSPLSYIDFKFQKMDILVLGQESSGFPKTVLDEFAHQITIPMKSGQRSLNVAIAGAIVLGEALRQTHLI